MTCPECGYCECCGDAAVVEHVAAEPDPNTMDPRPMASIHLDYDEFSPETYRGVIARVENVELFRNVDPNPAVAFMRVSTILKELGYHVMCASSVDHYTADAPRQIQNAMRRVRNPGLEAVS